MCYISAALHLNLLLELCYSQWFFCPRPPGDLTHVIRAVDIHRNERLLAYQTCIHCLSRMRTHSSSNLVFSCVHLLWSKWLPTLPLTSASRAVNHPEYPSVLQALEIDDPNVANCLIDMRGIETVLIIKVCVCATKTLYVMAYCDFLLIWSQRLFVLDIVYWIMFVPCCFWLKAIWMWKCESN